MQHTSDQRGRIAACIHSAYYLFTGLWPVVHLESFLAVTGPKSDLWLVRFFGVLVAVPGLMLASLAIYGVIPLAFRLHMCLLAAVIGAGDLLIVLMGRVPPVYLIDAVAEFILIGLWILTPMPRERAHVAA